ncbi:LysR family transcriptional regulator [Ochrobactrum teleogrylli]|uniref:LysR family transcriptional regulator n=1 Tax=Ochrobactrum teleogrylli TaxID=2479765 RepID=A0ABD5K0D8_9HYPH
MEIELRQLRYFMAVADHGGMRRAADALGVLHGTLSHRLRDLEEEVGVALFFRSNKGVKLTKAGQDFLRRIRRVFNEMQEAFDQVYAEGDVETGEVSIGLFSSLASGFLPELLSEYKHENPSIRLRYSQGSALSHIGEIRSLYDNRQGGSREREIGV